MVNVFGVMARSTKYRFPVKRFSLDVSLLKEKKSCYRNRWCSFFFCLCCLSGRFRNYFFFEELYFLVGVLGKLVLCAWFLIPDMVLKKMELLGEISSLSGVWGFYLIFLLFFYKKNKKQLLSIVLLNI